MNINIKNYRDTIGIFFFALSIILLLFMVISPLNQYVINFDEYFTITLIHFPISDMINITANNVHPPLHYLILKFAVKALSILGIESNIFAFKVVSIIPYALLLIVSATKVRKEYGWLAAGLFTFSLGIMSEFFKFYVTIRMYSWAILFLILAYIYLKDVLTKKDIKSWILLAIFSVLGAYTHYYAAISAVCLYLILFVYILVKDKEQIKYWFISAGLGIVLYTPWILTLVNQLIGVHNSYWIPDPNFVLVVSSLGYFVDAGSNLGNGISFLILIILTALYLIQPDKDENDTTFILMGIGVYVVTIALSLLLSVTFKPILVVRYLLPASAVLWLSISVLTSKLENKKMFFIAFGLILLLFLTGISNTLAETDSLYKYGAEKENAFDQITQNNDSILVLPQTNMIIYFIDYCDQMDVYCFNYTYVFGENMSRMHDVFDFKEITEGNLTNLVANNSDKDIYMMIWKDYDFDPTINNTTVFVDKSTSIHKLTSNV